MLQEILGLGGFGASDIRKFMVVMAMPMLRAAIDGTLRDGVLSTSGFCCWVCVIRLELEWCERVKS